ncbi:MAG: hypothetical protein Ta2B_14350 [Termitinemataceae bacterium]|nr:MAG: hypothetical protein Ta2B_14350 [Termitinemataceae bacterium]
MNTISQSRTVQVACTGTCLMDFRQIRPMQGSLKIRNKSDIDKIIKSIILHGFSFPFFLWKEGKKNHALDGHGRISALSEMQKTGYTLDEKNNLVTDDIPWTIPPLPVVFIEAKNKDEAKEKLLKLNSRYGMITEASFKLFTDGLKALDLSGISINFEKIELKTPEITAPLPTLPAPPQMESADLPTDPEFSPNFEPDIDTAPVTDTELEKADTKLETSMLHKGAVETIELCCPVCGESFSVRIADVETLISEARK